MEKRLLNKAYLGELPNTLSDSSKTAQLEIQRHFFNATFGLNFYQVGTTSDGKMIGFNFSPDGSAELWAVRYSELELDECWDDPVIPRTISDVIAEYNS